MEQRVLHKSPSLEAGRAIPLAANSTMQGSSQGLWWQGHLSGMTSRQVLALGQHCVVLCFSREDGGGCQCARPIQTNRTANGTAIGHTNGTANGAASETPNTIANGTADSLLIEDSRLPPPLPWGSVQLFQGAIPTGHLEVERLSSGRFLVCFERAEEGTTACSVGVVEDGDHCETLSTFGAPLVLGLGRLVSVTVLSSRRFAVCQRTGISTNSQGDEGAASRNQAAFSCRFGEVRDADAGRPPELRWSEDEPLAIAEI